MEKYKKEWLNNVYKELISGLVVCMALIPEAIGFTIVAGVDPIIGIYSCFFMCLITAFFGGRSGMVSAAAGSMALVLASLVKSHGTEYMLLATILTGVFQIIFGFLKIGNLLKFIPKSVMYGFVNSLAILMLISQLHHFKGPVSLILLGAIGLVIIYGLPKFTKVIPSPIVAIAVIAIIVYIFKLHVTTLGDMGKVTRELPKLLIPKVPFTFETLKIILPYSLSLSIVGIVESLLTAQLVDDMTNTESNKNQECVGQGLANLVTGLFGGIAGCGMIGQTITNQEYGGRGRLSMLTPGALMLLFVIVFNKLFVAMPVVALATVMLVVSITTFDFKSIINIKSTSIKDSAVMIITIICVVSTHNLAFGVIVGTVLNYILDFRLFKNRNVTQS